LRNLKSTSLALISLVLISAGTSALFAYGALSEFISADGTHFRDVMNGETAVTTDVIQNPMWDNASFPLQFTLCTNLSSTNVNYQTTKTTELLNDIYTAQNAWGFGTGSVLTFNAPVSDGSCVTGGAYDSAHRMILFDALPAGVLAYTPSTVVAQGGKLVIVDTDIVFNNTNSFQFLTHACDSAGSPSGTCTGATLPVTFLGVLTHEMGHSIGIAHSMINDDNSTDSILTEATMYPSISNRAESRKAETLTVDDKNARENLYPQTNFATTTGSVSGRVMRSATLGNRGAHVSVFDLTASKTITGAYTSMSGTRGNADGTFTINGIPFDIDFSLFVEPVDRTADGLSTSYANINTVLYDAIATGLTGLLAFKIEAYPDVAIPDVRASRTAAAAPGFTNATKFKLTSSSPTITGIVFDLSQSAAPPNDANGYTITFNSNTAISNSNPLTVTLSNGYGLQIFTTGQATLLAASTTSTRDWSKGLGPFTLTGTSSTVKVDRSAIDAPDGTYTVIAKFTDAKYGIIAGSQKITVSSWTSTAGTTGSNTDTGGSASAGGGCELSTRQNFSDVTGIYVWAFGFLAALLIYRKSFTSRESILSNSKQS
jgi:hypothetical protein